MQQKLVNCTLKSLHLSLNRPTGAVGGVEALKPPTELIGYSKLFPLRKLCPVCLKYLSRNIRQIRKNGGRAGGPGVEQENESF